MLNERAIRWHLQIQIQYLINFYDYTFINTFYPDSWVVIYMYATYIPEIDLLLTSHT